MSIVIPGHLITENTRALAQSALPDAPVEPHRDRTSLRTLVRALFKPRARTVRRLSTQTDPARC